MTTLKSLQRRAKRTNTLVERLIKRLGGENHILNKGIAQANTTILKNNSDIAAARVMARDARDSMNG
jgi:hypothetical protein